LYESGRGLGHVNRTIYGSTVGYPSDSLASCLRTSEIRTKSSPNLESWTGCTAVSLNCYMEDHTMLLATRDPASQPIGPVLDLPTPEGRKAKLT